MSKETKKNEAVNPMIEVAKFKETLKNMTLQQLQELEQKVIKETDEHNEAPMKLKFKMILKQD